MRSAWTRSIWILDILRSMKTFAFIATNVKRLVQFWGTKENLMGGIL